MQRTFVLLLLLASLLVPAASAGEKPSRWHTVWHISQALLAGGETADIASSWGKMEANPLVRTNQRFSYGSMAIKLGVLAGGMTAQHFMQRKHPEQTPVMASANLAAASIFGVAAAHNMHVSAPK